MPPKIKKNGGSLIADATSLLIPLGLLAARQGITTYKAYTEERARSSSSSRPASAAAPKKKAVAKRPASAAAASSSPKKAAAKKKATTQNLPPVKESRRSGAGLMEVFEQADDRRRRLGKGKK
jgi:hypothetical protein